MKAALGTNGLAEQNWLDTLETAWAEFTIVTLIAGGGTGEHDVVAIFAPWYASLVVFRVMLKIKEKKISEKVD